MTPADRAMLDLARDGHDVDPHTIRELVRLAYALDAHVHEMLERDDRVQAAYLQAAQRRDYYAGAYESLAAALARLVPAATWIRFDPATGTSTASNDELWATLRRLTEQATAEGARAAALGEVARAWEVLRPITPDQVSFAQHEALAQVHRALRSVEVPHG